MALKPKIELTGLSDTGNAFLLKDITGLYNSTTNPGGYGSPNIIKANVTSLLISLNNEGSLAKIFYQPGNISDFTDGTTAQPINVGLFGLGGYFTNGVIHVDYYTLLNPVTITTVTNSQFSVSSAAQFRGNEDVVVVGNVIYRVDTTKANTPSILYLLDKILAGTTSVKTGYKGTATIFNNKHLESELAKAIGSYAGRKCSCKSKDMLLDVLLKNIGAGVRYTCGDLQGAQNIVTHALNLIGGSCKC